jgi:beta-phosphoglucomutase-like phosphatase (HAD superfamily)
VHPIHSQKPKALSNLLFELPRAFEGYIFDCDGTLAESMEMHFKAWQYSLEKYAPQMPFTWALFRSMAGMGLHHTVKLVSEKLKIPLDAETLLAEQEIYCNEHLHLLERNHEVVAFAEWVASQNLPRSVASGGHRAVVHRTLDLLHLAPLFPVVVTQDDVVHGKPDPEIFLLAAKRMGLTNPSKILVLEDSLLGIQAAHAAGMASVLVRIE